MRIENLGATPPSTYIKMSDTVTTTAPAASVAAPVKGMKKNGMSYPVFF